VTSPKDERDDFAAVSFENWLVMLWSTPVRVTPLLLRLARRSPSIEPLVSKTKKVF